MLKSSSTAAIVTAAQVHTDNGRLFRKARREERRAEREKEQRDFPAAKRKSRSLPRVPKAEEDAVAGRDPTHRHPLLTIQTSASLLSQSGSGQSALDGGASATSLSAILSAAAAKGRDEVRPAQCPVPISDWNAADDNKDDGRGAGPGRWDNDQVDQRGDGPDDLWWRHRGHSDPAAAGGAQGQGRKKYERESRATLTLMDGGKLILILILKNNVSLKQGRLFAIIFDHFWLLRND